MTHTAARFRLLAAVSACLLFFAGGTTHGQDRSLERARALVGDGRYAEARPLLLALAKTHPRDDRVAACLRLGMLHEHRGRPAEARAAYEQALRLDSNRKEARAALRRLPREPS